MLPDIETAQAQAENLQANIEAPVDQGGESIWRRLNAAAAYGGGAQ